MANAACFHQDMWGHLFCPTHSLCSEEPSAHPLSQASLAFFSPRIPSIGPISPRSTAPTQMPKDSMHGSQGLPEDSMDQGEYAPLSFDCWRLQGKGVGTGPTHRAGSSRLVPSLTPHLSLALILGQVSQRAGWLPPVIPRLNNTELLSMKRFFFQICFDPRDYLQGRIRVWC